MGSPLRAHHSLLGYRWPPAWLQGGCEPVERVVAFATGNRRSTARMSGIGQAIGDAVSSFFADPTVGLGIRLIAAYMILLWLSVALWAFVDMRRRTSHLASAYGAAAFVVLASPLLFPLAVVILRIIRPAEFAAEHRLSVARESVLEAEFTAQRCPDCHRLVQPDWILCPTCRQQLAHVCGVCGRTVELDWPVCAWCGDELQSSGPIELSAHA
jgi:RNA polymerase subunit RPABC4/transcription elongation factor Spt4